MAVVYLQDPRSQQWSDAISSIANTYAMYKQKQQDQAIIQQVSQALGDNSPAGQSQGQPGQPSSPSAQATPSPGGGGIASFFQNLFGGGQGQPPSSASPPAPGPGPGPGQDQSAPAQPQLAAANPNAQQQAITAAVQDPNRMAPGTTPPNFSAAEALASRASPNAQALINKLIDAKKWQWQQQQTAERSDRSYALDVTKAANTAGHERAMEAQGQARLAISANEAKLATAREAREEAEQPLRTEALRTTIAKNKQQMAAQAEQQKEIWSPAEIDKAAKQFAARGFTSPPNFGWGGAAGSASATNKNNFWRSVTNLPLTPEQTQQMRVAYHMQMQEAATAGRTLANLQINQNKVEQLTKPLDTELAKLEPVLSNVRMFNRFKRAVLTGAGDPTFSKADIYTQSMLIAYAKALNPNGVTSVDLHKTVSDFLDTISSYKQLRAKLVAIHVDIAAERKAVEAGQSAILKSGQYFGVLEGKGNAAGSSEPGAAGPSDTGDDDPLGLLK